MVEPATVAPAGRLWRLVVVLAEQPFDSVGRPAASTVLRVIACGSRTSASSAASSQSQNRSGQGHARVHARRANIAHTKRIQTEILEAAGATDLLTIDRNAHLVGGCRMGTSPDTSVIDADHRVWGVPNLFVCDGSVMPTQGSANPALTIVALASRLGQRLAAKRVENHCG